MKGRYGDTQRKDRRQWRTRSAVLGGVAVLAVVFVVCISRCLPQLPAPSPVQHEFAATFSGDASSLAVVIYNGNDPLSRDLASFYAEKRGIAPDRVVALQCPLEEEISRQEYDDTIAGPLRRLFDEHSWWTRSPDRPGTEPSSIVSSNHIRYLVLMRGMPLKIRGAPNYPGDFTNQPSPVKEQNAASVESELAVLGLFTRQISGFILNPYYRAERSIAQAGCPGIMLACRLDAPTGATVRRMITDSLEAEKTGLWGRCYIDARGLAPGSSGLAEGDQWLLHAAGTIRRFLPTIVDQRPAMFPAAYPMGEAALYFGWYSEQVAGPFTQDGFRFRPGAVACHIHSYSATSVRDPARWWVAPLLEKGAAAVLGNVYEPYLGITAHLDIFADRLTDGYTLGESAYAAAPALSWMTTVDGDPLYRPGRVWQDTATDLSSALPPKTDSIVQDGRTFLHGAQIWWLRGPTAGTSVLERSGRQLRSGRIYEGLGLLRAAAGDGKGALLEWDIAIRLYKNPEDIVRVVLHEARQLVSAGQGPKALDLLRTNRQKYAQSPFAAALDDMITELQPPPPPPPHK